MSVGPEYRNVTSESDLRASLVRLPREESTRDRLVHEVVVSDKGIAICRNPLTGMELLTAAVRIDDSSEATLIPLKPAELGQSVVFELPADKPSRIGFFIGYNAAVDGAEASAVVRVGDYPGRPTAYQEYSVLPAQEVLLSLRGIKPTYLDENEWARQIDLFGELGFSPDRTRGHFAEFVRPPEGGDQWKTRSFVVTPDGVHDIVIDLEASRFQILSYEVGHPIKPLIRSYRDEGYSDLMFGATRGGLLKGYDVAVRGLSIGLGRETSTTVETGTTSILSLAGAIEVDIQSQHN